MINYDTIKSVYEDKLTLMQWLVKVQNALKDATAVSFDVNKRGDATLSFSIVFDDGTELETDPIILEQGESVESATLRNGHLILTLTNGDELDAGDMGAVSSFSIDANQHLIVTYQDGSTDDLGAIFTGNISVGNINAGIVTAGGGLRSNSVEPAGGSVVTINDISVATISSPNSNPIEVYPNIKCFEKILDSNGNLRFIEGDLTPFNDLTSRVDVTYAKWALSGTHLMIVLAGRIKANAEMITSDKTIFTAILPSFILDKIVGGNFGIIEYYETNSVAEDYHKGIITGYIAKGVSNISCHCNGMETYTSTATFRLSFDLIVDNA